MTIRPSPSATAPEAVAGARTGLAGALVVPATIFVAIGLIGPIAILFRYSLNQFIPGQFMVDGLTIENYVKFFTDSYYLNVLLRDREGRGDLHASPA